MLRAMKALSVAAVLLASVALALAPAVRAIYREAYPVEAAKRAALAACVTADPSFDRLIAGQRAQCYARQLQAPEKPEMVPRSLQIAQSAP
jgi:hypothetical protein